MTNQLAVPFSQPQPPFQEERLAPIQDDFYLLDVVGGTNHAVLHPIKPIVAYTSVYDFMSDSKINLCFHQHEVHALAFSPPGAGNSPSGGDYLVSVDFDKNDMNDQDATSHSTMCLWNWQSATCIQSLPIPKSNNSPYLLSSHIPGSKQNKNIQICFDRVGGLFFLLESGAQELGGGYRTSLWNLNRHQQLEMINQFDLELQSSCLCLSILSKNNQQPQFQQISGMMQSKSDIMSQNKVKFLTLEKNCIKIWEINSTTSDLIKRIHIKQHMKQIAIAEITGFLFILGENGKILILDQEGEFVSTISKTQTYFTTICIAHDKLLLGTERGTVCAYHMASLQFINEVPYQLTLLSNFNLNNVKPKCKQIINKFIAENQRYKDKFSTDKKYNTLNSPDKDQDQLSIFKLGPGVQQIASTTNMRFLMIKYQDSSFTILDRTSKNPQQAIMGYSYGHFEEITGMIWMNTAGKKRFTTNWSASGNTDCFITCSSDMGVFLWKHFGDRWQFSYIDTVKCFDQSLSFQRKNNEKSIRDLSLKSIFLYPRTSLLAVGDNRGVLRLFQFDFDRANLVSQYKLVRPEGSNGEDGLKEMHITQDEQYAIVAFESGLICCYDAKNSYNFLGIIEKDSQRFAFSNMLELQIKVLEQPQIRRQNDYLNQTFDSDIGVGKVFQKTYRVLYTSSPNSIRLQQVDIKGNKLNKSPLVQFVIDEGKIQGFDVHPSLDYLLVTSNRGRIYVFRIDTGELRGTIKIPLHAKGCVVDPSGLYVLISVPPFSQKYTQNLFNEQEPIQNDLGINQNDIERTTILMFEIGTGLAAAEVRSIFEISQMKFSPDAKNLSLGSKSGAVCVWALGEHLYSNIKQVLDTVQVQPDFWGNYPIFLPDYGTYGMEITPVKMQNQFERDPIATQELIQQEDKPEFYQRQRLQDEGYLQSIRSGNSVQGSQKKGLPISQIGIQEKVSTKDQFTQDNRLRSIENSMNKNLRQQELKDQQQQKFIRKTFVEDQYTQMTPGNSVNQGGRQRQRSVDQTNIKNQQSIRSAQIQTSNVNYAQQSFGVQQQTQNQPLPQIPTYGLQTIDPYRQQQQFQQKHFTRQQSIGSAISQTSPNKAELLYSGAYQMNQPQPELQRPQSQQRSQQQYQQQRMQDQQISPYRAQEQFKPIRVEESHYKPQNTQDNYLSSSPAHQKYQAPFDYQTLNKPYKEEVDPIYQPIKKNPHQDFIDRTAPNQVYNLRTDPEMEKQPSEPDYDPYEEDNNAAQLYNPFRGHMAPQVDSMVMSKQTQKGQQISPIRAPANKGRIEAKPKIVNPDPCDIDDDTVDNPMESVENQVRELDGMNKYLQNIRVPTKFVGDDFLAHNQKDPEKAYTLERLRQEEKFLGDTGQDEFQNFSQNSSTYEVVEEMYGQMTEFDQKLKYRHR